MPEITNHKAARTAEWNRCCRCCEGTEIPHPTLHSALLSATDTNGGTREGIAAMDVLPVEPVRVAFFLILCP